jgi:hypothetical protein
MSGVYLDMLMLTKLFQQKQTCFVPCVKKIGTKIIDLSRHFFDFLHGAQKMSGLYQTLLAYIEHVPLQK